MSKKKVGGAVAAVLVLWLYGAIHVVYGEGLGIGACWKDGWSYSDTFVDIADFKAARFGGDRLPSKVEAALDDCTLVPDDGAWRRDKIFAVGLIIAITIAGIIYEGTKRKDADE